MIKVHKICIEVNNKQNTYFAKSCGVARFAYNWALAEWQRQYQSGEKPPENKLRKQLNSIKHEQFPWMLEVPKVAPQQAIKNLGEAFKRFFTEKGGYPKFKKKYVHDSFRADNGPANKVADAVKIVGKRLHLPVIGWVKLTEKLRFNGRIKSVSISRVADRWYAAISVEVKEISVMTKNHGIIGIDVGINTLATLSNAEEIPAVKPYNKLLKKVKRFNRIMSRRALNGASRAKVRIKLARLHAKISNIRQDVWHKLTTKLVSNFSGICIEDLNIKGMSKNRRLARHILDCGFYEFKRQLQCKCQWYGRKLIVADKFFASSKICNNCNYKNTNLQLSDRIWQCRNCLSWLKRDLNAALNLEKYFVKLSSVREAFPDVKPVGEEGSSVCVIT